MAREADARVAVHLPQRHEVEARAVPSLARLARLGASRRPRASRARAPRARAALSREPRAVASPSDRAPSPGARCIAPAPAARPRAPPDAPRGVAPRARSESYDGKEGGEPRSARRAVPNAGGVRECRAIARGGTHPSRPRPPSARAPRREEDIGRPPARRAPRAPSPAAGVCPPSARCACDDDTTTGQKRNRARARGAEGQKANRSAKWTAARRALSVMRRIQSKSAESSFRFSVS